MKREEDLVKSCQKNRNQDIENDIPENKIFFGFVVII